MALAGRLLATAHGLTLAIYLAMLVWARAWDEHAVLRDEVLGNLLFVLPAGWCLARALRERHESRERREGRNGRWGLRAALPYLLMALGCTSFTAGNMLYVWWAARQDPIPSRPGRIWATWGPTRRWVWQWSCSPAGSCPPGSAAACGWTASPARSGPRRSAPCWGSR